MITGFRVAYGGAQERLAVTADLTCLGKIVGGGLPAAAFGGRGDVMERLAPLGDVYQAGTLAGNPLAMAAGSATLELLRQDGAYEQLELVSAALGDGLASTGVTVNRVGAMLTGFFHPARSRASPTLPAATPDATPRSMPTCSTAVCTSRPRSSRP